MEIAAIVLLTAVVIRCTDRTKRENFLGRCRQLPPGLVAQAEAARRRQINSAGAETKLPSSSVQKIAVSLIKQEMLHAEVIFQLLFRPVIDSKRDHLLMHGK